MAGSGHATPRRTRRPAPDGGTALERYRGLSDAVFGLYADDRQREALTLLAGAGPDLQPWRAELAHLEACLLGSLGEHDRAFEALRTAHAAGDWWNPDVLEATTTSPGSVAARTSSTSSPPHGHGGGRPARARPRR